jgi:hypothetical protein
MDVSEERTARANTLWDEATGVINPSFVPKFKSLRELVGCSVENEPREVAALLDRDYDTDVHTTADINSLVAFLGAQEIRTFRHVGGLPDEILAGMVLRMETMTPATTPGTFNNFLELRGIFRPMVLLQQQQGKREEKRTGAEIFIQVGILVCLNNIYYFNVCMVLSKSERTKQLRH